MRRKSCRLVLIAALTVAPPPLATSNTLSSGTCLDGANSLACTCVFHPTKHRQVCATPNTPHPLTTLTPLLRSVRCWVQAEFEQLPPGMRKLMQAGVATAVASNSAELNQLAVRQ